MEIFDLVEDVVRLGKSARALDPTRGLGTSLLFFVPVFQHPRLLTPFSS
jgi:hypothetical protein